MKRRAFLAGGLASGATLTIVPSHLRATTTRNSTLQFAQIGCGRMGVGDMTNLLNSGWNERFNARIVACCDVDSKRARAAADSATSFYQEKGENKIIIGAFTDHRELLKRDDIDGFIISTPDHWHGLIGIGAAEAGKHIYMQKPLTYSIAEGRALVEAVRGKGVVLQTGSQQRSSIYFRQICHIIRNEWLGSLLRIEVEIPTDGGRGSGQPTVPPATLDYDRWQGPSAELPYVEARVHPQSDLGRPGWLQVEAYCLGMITGWGSHMYDIAQWAMGDDKFPSEIEARGEFPERGFFDVHVGFHGEAVYDHGVIMTSRNGEPGVKFVTKDGWARCARGKMDCSDKRLLRRQPTGDEIVLKTSTNHMEDFIRSIRDGSDPVCPVEVGHRSNSICVLHHLSMKLGGRKLRWDRARGTIADDEEAAAKLVPKMRPPYVMGSDLTR